MMQQFPIETLARFLWREPDGAVRIGAGVTRNISRNGVSIQAQEVPSPGAEVQVIIEMPSQRANAPSGRLMGKGVAVRVQHEEGRPASFAAQVRFQLGWASPQFASAPAAGRDRPSRKSRPPVSRHVERQPRAVGAPPAQPVETMSKFYPLQMFPITSVSEAAHMPRQP